MAICPGAKATVQKRVRTAHSLSPSKIGPPLQRWRAEGDENRPPVANANGKGVRGPPASYPGPFRYPLPGVLKCISVSMQTNMEVYLCSGELSFLIDLMLISASSAWICSWHAKFSSFLPLIFYEAPLVST